jgi:hypothetical protein
MPANLDTCTSGEASILVDFLEANNVGRVSDALHCGIPSPIFLGYLTFGTLLRPDRRLLSWQAHLSPTTVDLAMVGAEYELKWRVESLDDATTPNGSNAKV